MEMIDITDNPTKDKTIFKTVEIKLPIEDDKWHNF